MSDVEYKRLIGGFKNLEVEEYKECNCNRYNTNWNVVPEDRFKYCIQEVFTKVSDALRHTFGPYGSTTIIEQYGEMVFTKDGWMVLKNIKFDDPLCNNIMMLLLRISAQVVIKVGDGSTSSIIAAKSILDQIEEADFLKEMRSKEFIDLFRKCVDIIVENIRNHATKIEDNFDAIYKLAHVSTNGDDNIANIIKTIYEETHNPSIEYSVSKTNDTYYEVIDGYKSNITYLDSIFVTHDDGTCKVKNPLVLMFDHKIDTETALKLISLAASRAVQANTRLVVIAPHYDKSLLDYIRKNVNIEYKSRGTTTIVYARASLLNNLSHEMYNDFAIMCGAQVISTQFIEEITDETLPEYIGTVGEMSIGEKTTFISNFTNRNEAMYEVAIKDATNKYNTMYEENKNRGIVDIKLNEVKQRLAKLRGKMGAIYVGGGSELEKTANSHLVEDAVKACESAYEHGYNCGGNLIIPRVINELKNDTERFTVIELEMLNLIEDAFYDVYATLLRNKYPNDDAKIADIMKDMLCTDDFDVCYDLVTDTTSKDIINSCETDIEILKATASIISLLISSNQYISIMPQK